jgi:hypothetical protein
LIREQPFGTGRKVFELCAAKIGGAFEPWDRRALDVPGIWSARGRRSNTHVPGQRDHERALRLASWLSADSGKPGLGVDLVPLNGIWSPVDWKHPLVENGACGVDLEYGLARSDIDGNVPDVRQPERHEIGRTAAVFAELHGVAEAACILLRVKGEK